MSPNSDLEIFAPNEKFTAKLSGKGKVPPVYTQATGMAEFTPNGENVD